MSLGIDYLGSLLEEDKEKGIFRCKREMFTNPQLFDLEMKHIFEGNWIYRLLENLHHPGNPGQRPCRASLVRAGARR